MAAASLERTDYHLFINGESKPSAAGETYEVHNPATNEPLARVSRAVAEDAEHAVSSAKAALTGKWARFAPLARSRALFKLAGLMRDRFNDLARLETLNNGKAISSVKLELNQSIEDFELYAGAMSELSGATIPAPKGFLDYTLREPVGVCALIIPWNYPLMLASWKLAPALAAGNTVVLKPASLTPLTALVLGELTLEAGIPAGVVNVITGSGGVVGDYLVAHPDVNKVSFTGETTTGQRVMQHAAGTIKRVTLELGGKSPNLIFADASLDEAVSAAVWSIYYSAGQSCEARSRVLIEASVYDQVVTLFIERAQALKVGDPLDESTHVGALISPGHLERVDGYVKAGVKEGARVACGGMALPGKGNFYAPTALDGVNPKMTVAQEEIFGPVAVFQRFESEDEAIALANDSRYGLAASVWTNDLRRGHRVAAALQAGTIGLNTPFTTMPGMPFGGYKQSGFGREHALETIRSYTETKNVLIYHGTRPINPFGI